MDIQKLYEEIQQKYSLEEGAEELFLYEKYLCVCKEHLLSESNRKIAIYGAGKSTDELITSVIWKDLQPCVEVIVDNYYKENDFHGIPVINEEELINYETKTIMISSWKYRLEMVQSICDKFPYIEVFDPYQYILEEFPGVSTDFFAYKGVNKYQWFAERKRQLECMNCPMTRQKILRELIHGYFTIYDWVDLKNFLSIYTKENYSDSEKYNCLSKDIEVYLAMIQQEIQKREQGDCLVFMVDALSKYVANDMPNLSAWGKSGTVFTNLINEYPSTRDVLVSLFTGWHPLKDKTSVGRRITYHDSLLLKTIKEKQVEIKIIISDGFCEENFCGINSYVQKEIRDTRVLTEILFEGLKELMISEKQQIVFMYSDETIHPPHWNPRSKKLMWRNDTSWEEHKKRFNESIAFTDDIVNFYLDFLQENKSLTKIVMGDHGINLKTEYAHDIARSPIEGKIGLWDIETISPILMIWHKKWKAEIISQMVSMGNFHRIMYAIIEGVDVHEIIEKTDFLELEFVPGYNENWIKRALDSDNYYLALGAKGIISTEYIFLRFENDTDRLFKIYGKNIKECNDELANFIEKIGKERYEACKFPQEILEDKFFYVHNRYYQNNKKKYDYCNIRHLDLEITERCSLKCRDCFNCMQYYKQPQDISLNRIKKSLDILSEYVDEIKEVRILGGEPFMNRNLGEIVDYVYNKDNIGSITIYTNATIIPSKKEMRLFADQRVSFCITDYGIKNRQKIDQIENLLQSYGISYKISRLEYWYKPGDIYENCKSEEELESIYRFCWGRDCITLLDGKLFQCELAANVNRLGMIPDYEQDYVNLFDTENLRTRLVKYIYEKKYMESCRWCNLTTEKVIPGVQI